MRKTGLAPYVSAAVAAYGSSVMDKVTDGAADATADATVGLGVRILHRLMGGAPNPERIEAALEDVAAHPEDEDLQAALRGQVRRQLAASPELAEQLLADVRASGQRINIAASGARSVAAQSITGVVLTGDSATVQRG